MNWATRASLFDRRLRFAGLPVFYADYKDVQVPGIGRRRQINSIRNVFVGVTTNAGKATFKGIELEHLPPPSTATPRPAGD